VPSLITGGNVELKSTTSGPCSKGSCVAGSCAPGRARSETCPKRRMTVAPLFRCLERWWLSNCSQTTVMKTKKIKRKFDIDHA
jgi:hypothetical protein